MKNVFFIAIVTVIIAIATVILFSQCSGGGRRGGGTTVENENVQIADTLPPINPVINIYIENSGSMDGYVKGNTEFKNAIQGLLVLLKFYYGQEKINIYFINTKIRRTDTQTDLATFATRINALWRLGGEKIGSTELNDVFKMILEKTDRETISVLFSDCIYSINGKDAEGLLLNQKNLTQDAFLSRWRQDSLRLATTIVKMNSKFDGIYYDKDNRKTTLYGVLRPYYICIIGNRDVMIDFNAKIHLEKEKIEGFENKYILSTGASDNMYYSVLISTDNVGRFKPNRKDMTSEYIHGIYDVKMNNRSRDGSSKFTFAVAVDLKNMDAEEDYYMNPVNYVLGDNNFRIKEIKRVEKNHIHPSDWLKINAADPTHLIVLEATGAAISNVKVSLKKQMPQWIEQTNIIDDRDIRNNLNKTFGIKYLIEGIAEAYQIIYPDDKFFFEFEIKIN